MAKQFLGDDQGQDLIEYALLLALLALATLGAVAALGDPVTGLFVGIRDRLALILP